MSLEESEPAKCGAKLRNGGTCKNSPGRTGRCYKHGDRAGRPPTHGRNSKAVERLGVFFVNALNDRDLMNLAVPIAKLRAICERLEERYGELDTGDFRGRVAAQLAELADALPSGSSTAEARSKLGRVRELVKRGADEDRVLTELLNAYKTFCERVEARHRIDLAKEHAINERDAIAVLARFCEEVRVHAPPDIAARILQGTERFLSEAALRSGTALRA